MFQRNKISLEYIKNKIRSYEDDAFEVVKKKSLKNDFFSHYSLTIAYLKIGKHELAIDNLNIIKNNYKNYPFFYV